MMPKGGLKTYGLDIDPVLNKAGQSYGYLKNVDYINQVMDDVDYIQSVCNVSSASLISLSVPYVWYRVLKQFNINAFVLSNHPLCSQLFTNHTKINVLTADLQTYINQSDCIVFPEIQYLAPLDLFKFDLSDKLVVVVHHLRNNKDQMHMPFIDVEYKEQLLEVVKPTEIISLETFNVLGIKYHRLICRK